MKDSLIVDFEPLDSATAADYLSKEEKEKLSAWTILKYDFVLVTESEASGLRDLNSKAALESLGQRMKIYNGLPIPDVD